MANCDLGCPPSCACLPASAQNTREAEAYSSLVLQYTSTYEASPDMVFIKFMANDSTIISISYFCSQNENDLIMKVIVLFLAVPS